MNCLAKTAVSLLYVAYTMFNNKLLQHFHADESVDVYEKNLIFADTFCCNVFTGFYSTSIILLKVVVFI